MWPTDKLSARIRFSSELGFVLGVTLLWLALYNLRFWQSAAAAMWHPSLSSVLFMGSLFLLALLAQALLLLLLPRVLLRPVACALFLAAALIAYFSDTFGVFMDKDMLRNVFATDSAEVAGLINGRLLTYFLLLGVLPCVLILRAQVPPLGWKQRLKQRSVFLGGLLVLCLVCLFALSAAYASFFREHKPVRLLLNPASAVYNLVELGIKETSRREPATLAELGGPVIRVAALQPKPLMLFLVIGETARAGNFQLGGYDRPTNPQLASLADLLYFKNTTSCGTATETSLPCIFSPLGRSEFDVDAAKHQTNLLDMLASAGLDVEWRDNNSGCKGVCARVRTQQFTSKENVPACHGPYCYDEEMTVGLADRLRAVKRDCVIVFHQVGSHGPAYWQRYPPQFEKFKPACHSTQLDRCSREAVINAYDNTILYTDHNLAQQIQLLQQASDKIDSLLIYVSDHGESLGENGVYLHGMPYALAPDNQKEVPFMVWMSAGYRQRTGIDEACLRARTADAFTHDNVFHSVMGAVGVRNAAYKSALDIFSGCAKQTAFAATTPAEEGPMAGDSRMLPALD
ncbi:MAG TPA: phosphoethanolamine--lipid A transferase [Povalibacter sp.]|nr:phosphoethanolamine--lipid A transferase [Povalibacter sp.]